jgi:HAE1 family hydrophobic/amphiphilic exporter-1
LVDDAIVEVENTVRHMHEHPTIDVRSAAKAAASEIGLAVLATTVTILAVFVPVTFIPGLPGRYFREFGLTVASAVFFSLLVARLLTPVMCGAWLRRGGRQVAEHPVRRHAFIGGYAALSRLSLKYRWVTLSAAGLFFAGAILVMRYLPQDFVAASDRSRTVMLLEMDPGTSLAETTAAVGRATRLLLDRPEVQAVFAVVGATSFLGGVGSGSVTRTAETNVALLTVPLVPRRERALSQGQFEASIRSVLQTIPGARVQSGADGAPGARLNVTLVSRDPSALNQAARDLERQMRDIPGLGGARTGASLERPEILIKPLLAQAAELGVSPVAIATTARIATLGDSMQNLARFNLTDRQVAIRVMLPEETRADLRHLARLRVETHNGSAVPLDAVADIEHGSGLARIERLDRLRAARIETELQGLPFGEAMRLIRETAAMRNLPEGVTERPADDAELLEEMNAGFAVALITGIGLVYLVLVLLFSSFSLPLTIMTALPLSLGGALIALVLAQKPLGLSAIIGTLMLMGIVAKNSILLVEHAIDAQRRGMAREAALLDAAATRARPIIMTSLAMIAGMLHIAAGIGADAEFRSPMALVLVGGLITSTILSLIVVPAAYTVVDDAAGLAGRAGRRLKSYRAGTER